jgi:hypothetical protein
MAKEKDAQEDGHYQYKIHSLEDCSRTIRGRDQDKRKKNVSLFE